MQQTSAFRKIISCLLPRKSFPAADPKQWENYSFEQKQELASQFLAQGEIALMNDDLSALSHFEAAATIQPENADTWYREGLSFFEYGLEEGKEKALLIASRYFKLAAQLAPGRFEIWSCWGSVLLHLGIAFDEYHYYLEAKDKLERAVECSGLAPKAQLYWDLGLAWAQIAQHSGEAVDIRTAIEAFKTSMRCQDVLAPEFLTDCGNAYLQMGLLINDARLYLQAVDYLKDAVKTDSRYDKGWTALSNAYAQLYLNTMDERYASMGSDCYAHLCQEWPKDAESFLGWAQILCESGRQNREAKKLALSIEKCAACHDIDPDHPMLISQWVESLSELGRLESRLDLLIDAETKILRATDQFPDDPDLWLAYGICLIAFGEYFKDPDYFESAIEKLQFGLSLDRTHAEIWHALARAHKEIANLTDELDMIERACRFFSRAIILKPACPSLMFDAANAWMLSCEFHDEIDDLKQAMVLYEWLLQNQKEALLNHPEWLFQYAVALEWLGDFTDDDNQFIRALDLYLHVLLLEPEMAKIHFHIAICFTRLGETSGEDEYLKRALHHYRFAAKQDEEDEEVWLEWGICLINFAEQALTPEGAQQCFADAEQKIIRSGQLGNQNAYYNLACLYSLLGHTKEAMKFILKARQADALPTAEEMVEDDWLDNLRQTESFAQFLLKHQSS